MGLKGGKTGVKAILQDGVPTAFRRSSSLVEIRNDVLLHDDAETLSRHNQTAVLVDGNVLMMAVPEVMATFYQYVQQVFEYIEAARRAACLVVVVFDEPEHLTGAKHDEQMRRDAARKKRKVVACSSDLEVPELSPTFALEELLALGSVHHVKDNRKTRTRFFDAVIRSVFDRFKTMRADADAAGSNNHGTVVFDGIDMRACERSAHEPRQPFVIGTTELGDAFERDVPIGEGDIKLVAVETRLRQLAAVDDRLCRIRLVLVSTVDTDSLMTMLLDQRSARRVHGNADGRIQSVLCMREPARRPRNASSPQEARASCFLCCDVALLEEGVQRHLWNKSSSTSSPTRTALQGAMIAFCCAAAACGCDFTGLPGSRFDHFWEALPSYISSCIDIDRRFGPLLGDDGKAARSVAHSLKDLCVTTASHVVQKPRYKRQAALLEDPPESLLKRSVWTVAYWSQREHVADVSWGFEPVCGASQTQLDSDFFVQSRI
jgi:hypothetical protein